MTTSEVPALIAAHAGRLRLSSVTRLLRSPARADGSGSRVAALAGCHHGALLAGTPFLFGWLRAERGGPITVLTTSPVTGAGLIYPPAAIGHLLAPAELGQLLDRVPSWVRLNIGSDALVTAGDRHEPVPLDETLLDAWTEPFAWLAYATPIPADDLAERTAQAAETERDARTRTGSPAYEVAADRARARHRELRAAETTGAWQVHLLAAATGAPEAATLAGLLATAIDLTPHGYAVRPSTPVAGLDAAIADTAAATLTGTPVLAALAQPPTAEIPGVAVHTRSTFAVTPPATPEGLILGRVLDRSEQPAGQLLLSPHSLVRHTFVTGATGSGKSTTIQHLLGQATTHGVPWLVVEPTKTEYRHRLDATVLSIGGLDTPAVGINPLQPATGFPLRTHADMLKALLVAAFHADEPFPQIIAAAIETCYRDTGWDLALGAPSRAGIDARWPTLNDLAVAARTVIAGAGYGREIEANVTGFVTVRLSSLTTGSAAAFLTARHDLDMNRLLRSNVIIELDDIGDDTDKAVVMGTFLMRLTQQLRSGRPAGSPLRHLTVIEEAHRLLRRTNHHGAATTAVETFAAMLAEIRAYGEGLIIADQIPAKLIPDVIKNTAVKIVHRLPGRDDRDAVGAAMNLTDDHSEHLVSLPPGTAAVATDGMRGPVLAVIPTPDRPETTRPAPSRSLSAQPAVPTVRALAQARALATAQPALAIWADLVVLAHLLALPMPTPREPLRHWAGAQPGDLLRLALYDCVDAAIASRTRAIAASHSPTAFADHIFSDLTGHLATQQTCPDPVQQWWIEAFRHNPMRYALIDTLHADRDAPRHHDSGAWEQMLGQAIPGTTAAEQLAALDTLSVHAEHHLNCDLDQVLYGTPAQRPTLTGCDPADPRWPTLLDRHLAALHIPGSWVRTYLTRRVVTRP